MKPQRMLAILLVIVAAACDGEQADPGTAGTVTESQTGTSSTTEPERYETSIRLAWLPDMAEAGIFVAQDKEFFKKHGLEVDIRSGGFGLDPIKLVATGSDDFGVGGAGNLLLAKERGIPVKAIAAEFQQTPVVFVTRNPEIANFAAFRGRRIGVQTGADTEIIYRALLKANDMTPKDVTEVRIEYDMSPLLTGAIDVLPGYVTNQPVVLRKRGEKVREISPRAEGVQYYGNVFFTSDEMLAEHPEIVRRFVDAVVEGWQYALKHKDDTVKIMMKHVKQDYDTLSRSYDAMLPYVRTPEGVPLLSMSQKKWQQTYDVLVANDLARKRISPHIAYMDEFVEVRP